MKFIQKVLEEAKRQLITFKYLLPFRMPIKEIENIDFIAEENTFMKFIHREHNIFEKITLKERDKHILKSLQLLIKINLKE